MNTIFLKRYLFSNCLKYAFIIILTAFLVFGCSSGSDDPPSPNDNTTTESPDETLPETSDETISAMALVLDTKGNPIQNAMVGADVLTNKNGVAGGDFDATSEGWVQASAPGYVTGYMNSEGTLGDYKVYETILTPFGDMAYLENGETDTLFLGDPDNPTYEAGVNASFFVTTPVTVSLTEIAPLDINPLFEDLNTGENLNLQKAFALCAKDSDEGNVSLYSGMGITVRIRDNGELSDNAKLAFFNPDSSKWEVINGGCERDGVNHFRCIVPSLFSFYGLFDNNERAYLASKVGFGYKVNSGRTAKGYSEDQLGGAYQQAKMRVYKRLKELEAICAADPSNCDFSEDQELQDALDDLAKAARDYAAANQNENGKFALMKAAERAISLGKESLATDLMNEASALAAKMADDLLEKIECKRIREILLLAQQNMLMGNISVAEKLEEKLKTDLIDCDLWTGTIHYWLPVETTDARDWQLESGGGSWHEFHDVRMTTDVNTFKLTGEDMVQIAFPVVEYENVSMPCKQSFTYGPTSSSLVYLTFDGNYDGHTFSVNNPETSENPVTINWNLYVEVEADDGCTLAQNQSFAMTDYSSLLVHGFLESPPITIQEMLENGTHRGSGESETIRGNEEFENPNPEDGRFPVTHGYVIWNFIHVQAILPLDQ
ncbi:MAG: hypothetical protein JRI91_03025 [Deltaproteobacteria bacterium]|nr:hypothetical protein [Deltaproteobacteria bacterium]